MWVLTDVACLAMKTELQIIKFQLGLGLIFPPPFQKAIIYPFIIIDGKTTLKEKANGDPLPSIL